jgi:hypothetical protein
MNMHKTVAAFALALLAAPLVQGIIPFPAAKSLAAGSTIHTRAGNAATAQSTQKVIKDPAEYNAYIAALNTQDPKQKAAAMLAFLQQYPNTIMKTEALEQARAAYQAAGDVQKLEEVSRLILKDNPNDVQSLALVTAIDRNKGTPQSAAQARAEAEKGLQLLPTWTKPEGTSDADFGRVKNQMTIVFNGAAGFGALQAQDYATAKNYYLKAIQGVQLDPNNMQDVYQLSIAKLEANSIDVDGFWYAAKAINLARNNATAARSISNYAQSRYKKYHGSYDGWDQIVAAAATQNAPPPNFAASIKSAPTPCDVAVEAVKQNDPDELSFSDREFILAHANCSAANKEAADKVWLALLAKQKNSEGTERKVKLLVMIISGTKNTLQAAITEENQQAKKADLTVYLEKPVVRPPAPGAMVNVTGVLTSYTTDPFMFTMEHGELPSPKPPPPRPAKRP